MIDLAALIQQCAPQVGPTTMAAIVRTESGGYPWALNDNTLTLPRQPATKDEAVAMASTLIAAGHSVDLGLGQVNSRNLPTLGLTVAQALDPCTNLRASSSILQEGYRRATAVHGEGQQALLAAISAYNTGNLANGFANGYVARVTMNAGLKIPGLRAGSVVSGRRGSVQVGKGGRIDPYRAPLTAWQNTMPPQPSRDPGAAPLAAAGFGSTDSQP